MELIVDKDRNSVFTFENGLVDKVWEPEPVSRFKFLNQVENEWLIEQLSANKPTAGIIFDGVPYIGTNDGMVYTPEKKIQRIPDIFVDGNLFLETFPYTSVYEKQLFKDFKKGDMDALYLFNEGLVQRMLMIDEQYRAVLQQERNIDRYLTGRLAIRGFGVSKQFDKSSPNLYDSSLQGVNETLTGNLVNDLPVHAIQQIKSDSAGFVPFGYPPIKQSKFVIEDGFEKEKDVYCVDYHSLWTLSGHGKMIDGICPRDGSGYSPAKFTTDGEVTAILHGNHPCHLLDIYYQEGCGEKEQVKSIEINPNKIPQRIMVYEGRIIGDYGNCIRDFSREEVIFSPNDGKITSISDSGLCTVESNNRTHVYDPFNKAQLDNLDGSFVFLSSTPK